MYSEIIIATQNTKNLFFSYPDMLYIIGFVNLQWFLSLEVIWRSYTDYDLDEKKKKFDILAWYMSSKAHNLCFNNL